MITEREYVFTVSNGHTYVIKASSFETAREGFNAVKKWLPYVWVEGRALSGEVRRWEFPTPQSPAVLVRDDTKMLKVKLP